jgi:hypothetical protein
MVLGVINYLSGKRSSIDYFVTFLIFVIIIEIFLNFYLAKKYHSTERMYSIYSFLCAAYYNYIFYKYFEKRKELKFMIWVIGTWIAYSILLLFTTDKATELKPYFVGMLIIVFYIINYLYKTLYVDDYRSLKTESIFYLGFGLLLFIFTTFPILFVFEIAVLVGKNLFFLKLLQYGNIFLSLAYLSVVLCMKK